jgi:cytochrome c oxidase cbb3-type subunit 4
MTWLNEVSTVVMFVAFIAIVVWAWSSKRKAAYDEAARVPLEDDDEPSGAATRAVRAGNKGTGA